MPVYSMTGYATVHGGASKSEADTPSASVGQPSVGLELRSVNSRFLDLSFKLSDELRNAEPALREKIMSRIKRGKVELRAWIEGRADGGVQAPSTADLQRLVAVQDHIRAWLPSAAPLSVAEVLQTKSRQPLSTTGLADGLVELIDNALDAFIASREREGARLANSLLERVTQLRSLAQQAQPLVPRLVEQQRQRFIERWNEALGAVEGSAPADMARDRALTEATAFAIRIDVAEELTRLASHLDEIESLLATGRDLGKRLDFLIQELHREANTLGSKSSSLELTRISVDMKVLIEQMREQVQNIE
jgi:uncharacterized protein (TIGR00255 family)